MNEMSLDEQIQRLHEMKASLGDFCKMMQQTMETMQNQIKYLRSQGFSIETEQTYQTRYYTTANSDVEKVVSDIYGRHFAYIDEVIEDLERAKNR